MQIRVDWSADAANKAGTEKLGRRCRIRVAWSADAANKAGTEKLGVARSADAANKAGTEKLGSRCRTRVALSADAANKAETEKLSSRCRYGWLGQQMQLIKQGRRSLAADADKGG